MAVFDAGASGQGRALRVVEVAPLAPGPSGQVPLPTLYLLEDGRGRRPWTRLFRDTLEHVRIEPNRLVREVPPGESWWSARSGSVTVRLSPFLLLVEAQEAEDTASCYRFSRTRRYDPPAFRLEEMVHDVTPAEGGRVRCDRERRLEALGMPALAAAPPFDWRSTRLGSCSLSFDAAGDAGFLLEGEAEYARGARLKALFLPPRTLLVEVLGARSAEDELEAWVAYGEPPGPRVRRAGDHFAWRVRLRDGRAMAGFGAPARLPEVARAIAGDTLRFRVEFPDFVPSADEPGRELARLPRGGLRQLTVVLSENDRAGGRRRRIATSRLVAGDADTLGYLEPLTCRVAGGTLVPVAPRPSWPE